MKNPSQAKKNDRIIIGLVILSSLLIISSFLAPIIFTSPSYSQRYNFKETGPIGDTIGGLMNPFIALAGVFITFLAFYMQLKANKIQIDLFNRNQDEQTSLLKEQLFFRLVDNLNQRIINFSYGGNTSYKSLDNLINKFLSTIDFECIALGKQLLASQPEKIDIVHYIKILQATTLNYLPSPENAERLKQSIVEKADFNDRWEYIKINLGSSNNEYANDALKAIGHVNFYKIGFSERESIYINIYDDIYREFGGFMDGYTKSLSYLIDFIVSNNENTFFIDYLKSNLSTQELILIFYFCASRKSSEIFRHKIKQTNLLDGITQARDKFIDLPSPTELKMETKFILDRIDYSL